MSLTTDFRYTVLYARDVKVDLPTFAIVVMDWRLSRFDDNDIQ